MECEAGVYALSSILSEDDSDVILLLDADNVFNRVNRNVMLNKILMICPVIAIYAINLYTQETRLLILGGEEITSVEGIIQGDPTAISISYIGILKNILTLWNQLNTFGHFPKSKNIEINCEARKI